MNMIKQPSDSDDINLREIIYTLWYGRWIIIAVPLIVAIITLILSLWVLPKKYQSTTYIAISNPLINMSAAEVFSAIQSMPDIKGLPDLAKAPGLLASVLADPSVVAFQNNNPSINLADLEEMFSASNVSQNLLSLQVTDVDPQRASQLANLWSVKVVDTINSTYGVDAIKKSVDQLIPQSKLEYDQAQVALEDELSKNRTDALTAQLTRENENLRCTLDKISATTRVVSDLQVLKQRLEMLPAENVLTLGDALSFITLQQRALSDQVCEINSQNLQIQVSNDVLASLTTAKAIEGISQILDALQTKQTDLTTQQTLLEHHIPQLNNELDEAENQLLIYQTSRDQSRTAYNNLSQLQKQISALTEGSKIATVSIEAVPSKEKVTPKVAMNTALVGITGLILAVLWVFIQDWWRNDGSKKPDIKEVPKD